jgi:hypothetical protein
MSQQPLRERLDQMRVEIAAATTADPANETLRKLHQQTLDALAEIDHSGGQSAATEFQPGLPAAIKDFEASHPSLTLAMMRVMDVLNGIGL